MNNYYFSLYFGDLFHAHNTLLIIYAHAHTFETPKQSCGNPEGVHTIWSCSINAY